MQSENTRTLRHNFSLKKKTNLNRLNTKQILYFSIVFLFSKFSYADDGIDAAIDKWLTPISDFVVGKVFYSISIAGADVKLIVLWLIAGSISVSYTHLTLPTKA